MIPVVSIVVPLYNEEKHMDKCIESILNQTLKELEIILVNDGSNDKTGEKCNRYRDKYTDKIKVVHKQNGGLTSAWKAGCIIASGQYIGFVDGDDFVEKEMYERMYKRALEDNSDMVTCGLKHIYEDDCHREWFEQMEFGSSYINMEENGKKIYPILINNGTFMGRSLLPCRVIKLVKKDIVLKNITCCNDNVSIGEDMQFSFCTILDCKIVSVLKDYFPYYYYMNAASMTMAYDEFYMDKIDIMRDNMLRISNDKNKYNFYTQIINDYLCLTILNIKGGICKRKKLSYLVHRRDMVKIRNNPYVAEALDKYDMPNLSIAEKIFIYMLKKRMYIGMYVAVKLYFR